jgi:hypothetical protein
MGWSVSKTHLVLSKFKAGGADQPTGKKSIMKKIRKSKERLDR